MGLEHERTLVEWSRERGAQVEGATPTSLFSVDVAGDGEVLVATDGGCELWAGDRGPRSLQVTMSSLSAAEKYLFFQRATRRRWVLDLAPWPFLQAGDPVADGVEIAWGDATTTVTWPEEGRVESIRFTRPQVGRAVMLSWFVRRSVDELVAAIQSPDGAAVLGLPRPTR